MSDIFKLKFLNNDIRLVFHKTFARFEMSTLDIHVVAITVNPCRFLSVPTSDSLVLIEHHVETMVRPNNMIVNTLKTLKSKDSQHISLDKAFAEDIQD